ncbi:hypothetical protein FRC06_003411 [Ceratobasidium sp. 370]|nr:hypothetical protein FRC06_003411 [Ceratobasidium sp. 370]
MSDASSNAGQAADNVEGTPNQVVATADEGNPISENHTEMDPVPQTPTLTSGQATPNEPPEVNLADPTVEGGPPPEHAPAPAPVPDPVPDPEPLDEDDAISPLMKGAGGFPGVLVDDEDENN